MKHTGKPPKKSSSSRSPVRAGGRSSTGRSSGKPAAKGAASGKDKPFRAPEARKGRHSAANEKRAERRGFDTAKPRRAEAGSRGREERGGRGDHPMREDRPRRDGGKSASRPRHETPARDFAPRSASRPRRDDSGSVREPRTPREPRVSLGPKANIFGLHAVREAWLNKKRSVHALYLTEQAAAQFAPVFAAGEKRGLERPEPKILSKDDFDRLLGRDAVHQGSAISAAPLEEAFIQDIISIGAAKQRSVVLLLDQVTDPHNVGAILRSACAFGADGVVMQRRHAPELEGVLAKTASGAPEHIPVAYETNLSRTLEELAAAGYVAIGLDEHAEKSMADIEVPARAVLVLGAEGDGMRRLVKEHCDVLVTLPTRAPIASLNVSNAAAVALYALIAG